MMSVCTVYTLSWGTESAALWVSIKAPMKTINYYYFIFKKEISLSARRQFEIIMAWFVVLLSVSGWIWKTRCSEAWFCFHVFRLCLWCSYLLCETRYIKVICICILRYEISSSLSKTMYSSSKALAVHCLLEMKKKSHISRHKYK